MFGFIDIRNSFCMSESCLCEVVVVAVSMFSRERRVFVIRRI